jgi:hypothetical protein
MFPYDRRQQFISGWNARTRLTMANLMLGPPNSSPRPSAVAGDVVIELGSVQGATAASSSTLLLVSIPAPTPAQLYADLSLDEGKREIRVLDLDGPSQKSHFWSRNKDDESPLTGRLRVVSLAASPRFTALSYVWGDYSELRDVIVCNDGCRIEITTNCRDALLALRRRFGAVTIWVDAICINQAPNATEKIPQIQLMEEIYSWAECTYVWLGPGDKKSDKAIDWLQDKSRGTYVDEVLQYATALTLKARLLKGWDLSKTILGDAFVQQIQLIKSLDVGDLKFLTKLSGMILDLDITTKFVEIYHRKANLVVREMGATHEDLHKLRSRGCRRPLRKALVPARLDIPRAPTIHAPDFLVRRTSHRLGSTHRRPRTALRAPTTAAPPQAAPPTPTESDTHHPDAADAYQAETYPEHAGSRHRVDEREPPDKLERP